MSNCEQDNHVRSDLKPSSTPFRAFFRPISLKKVSNSIFPTVYAQDSFLRVPFLKTNFDSVTPKSKSTEDLSRIQETGLDRLKQMFSTDDYGRLGPEWSLIVQGSYGGVIAGAFIGGFSGGRKGKEQHLRESQATKYHTEMHARRALQDKITINFMRGAIRFGAKMGAFTFFYIFTTTLSSVYRGKTNVLDFVVGGAVAGALWRMAVGPKAVLVSSGLGGFLGLFAGGLSVLALHLSGTSLEEIRYWHYHSHTVTKRSEVFGNEVESKDESEILQKDHDKLVTARSSSESVATDLKTKTSA